MRKRRIFTTTLTVIILIIAVASLALYTLGDKIFDEVISDQLQDLEATIDKAEEEAQNITDSTMQTPVDTARTPDTSSELQQTEASNARQTSTAQGQGQGTSKTAQATQTPSSTQPNAVEPPSIQITKDKLEDIKGSVTPSDKMSAAAMVLKRLSQSDIDTLTRLAAGGVTPAEKEKIKAIVYARFTQAEIQQIKAMYYKYMGK